MPTFGKTSLDRLLTCHKDLQTVLNEVIKDFDFAVISGERTIEEQQKLFAQGRTTKGPVVTWVDGVNKKSNHNYSPSRAVDIAPSPIDWNDRERFIYLAGHIMSTADRLFREGKIEHKIRWGGDWNNNDRTKDEKQTDLPHFEIII
jgi:peptidoglycan L-alanyl-D-glutamate endopeptidase CwlK